MSDISNQQVLDRAAPRGLLSTTILALGTFAVGTDAFVLAGFLPAIAGALHVPVGTAGQAVTVFAVAYAALSPGIATVTAHLPRRTLLVGALVVLALANVASALAPTFPVLLLARVLAAAGAAAYTPGAGAVSAALVPPALRARALAMVVGGLTIATAVGVPLGGLAARDMGWRTALLLVAALGAAAAAGVAATMPALPGSPRVPLRTRLAVLRRRGVRTVLPLTVLGMTACYTLYAYSLPALGAVRIDPAAAVWMLVLYGVGAIVGNFLAGIGTDRCGPARVLGVGYTVMALGLGAFAWAATPAGPHGPVLIALLMLAWGASSWCQTPAQQHRLIAAAPTEAPLVVGLNASAIYIGIALGTALGGVSLRWGIPLTAGVGAALAVVAGLFLATTKH
jgi:predicted MFS family arabinose efflux permease